MSKEQEVREILLTKRDDEKFWFDMEDRLEKGGKKEIEYNRFFFIAIMDRQTNSDRLVEKADELINDCLKDPENLWEAIRKTEYGKWSEWWEDRKFHRFHKKICKAQWENAKKMEHYGDNAQNIWEGCKDQCELENRLRKFSGVGPAIANMIIGGLSDLKQVKFKRMNIKPDVHVCRVMGRVFIGKEFTTEEAVEKAKNMYQENPWKLDRPLFKLGRSHCRPGNPKCNDCYLKTYCEYHKNSE